jgi:hypothetical protein
MKAYHKFNTKCSHGHGIHKETSRICWLELHQGTSNGPLSKLFLMHSYPSYVAI